MPLLLADFTHARDCKLNLRKNVDTTFAPLPMWCPFLSHSYSSFFSYFTTKKVDAHTFVSVYFHFTGAPHFHAATFFVPDPPSWNLRGRWLPSCGVKR